MNKLIYAIGIAVATSFSANTKCTQKTETGDQDTKVKETKVSKDIVKTDSIKVVF